MLKFQVVNDLLSKCQLSTACIQQGVSSKTLFAIKLIWNFIFVFSRVAHINWVTNGSGVISISIVGTEDSNSDKEPVFSVTMLRTAAMKKQLISQF